MLTAVLSGVKRGYRWVTKTKAYELLHDLTPPPLRGRVAFANLREDAPASFDVVASLRK